MDRKIKIISLLFAFSIANFAFAQTQSAKDVADLYLKMLVAVDNNAQSAYRTYSLPIDEEKGEGKVSDFSTLDIDSQFNNSAIYKEMISSIPGENSKISEIAIYMALYNVLGIYEPVKDKALQTSMLKLKDAIVQLLKNSTYKITNVKTEKDEYSENNSLKAEVAYEISIPSIDYKGFPKNAQQTSNKKQADYFNLLTSKIQQSAATKNTITIKEKFTLNEIKINGKSYWLPYQAFQIIDPIVNTIINAKYL